MLEEYEIELPAISRFAYAIASRPLQSIGAILFLAAASITTHEMLSKRFRQQAGFFSAFAIIASLLLVILFALAVLSPVYSVVTGLAR